MIYFEKIEVVNRIRKEYVYETVRSYGLKYDKTWIYGKIHHEINQFCSVHSLPEVYSDMFDQIYEQMEEERTKVLIVMEKQKVLEMEAETLKKIAVAEAKKNSEVSRIIMDQRLMEKESLKRQHEIDNEMYLAREKSLADSNYYKVIKEAEASKL